MCIFIRALTSGLLQQLNSVIFIDPHGFCTCAGHTNVPIASVPPDVHKSPQSVHPTPRSVSHLLVPPVRCNGKQIKASQRQSFQITHGSSLILIAISPDKQKSEASQRGERYWMFCQHPITVYTGTVTAVPPLTFQPFVCVHSVH